MDDDKPGRQKIWHADRDDPDCLHRMREAEYLKAQRYISGTIGVDGEMALSLTPTGRDYVESGGHWCAPLPSNTEATPASDHDRRFMKLAIDEARKSKSEDDRIHPMVGAVAVRDGQVLGAAHRGELGDGDHGEYTLLEKKLPNETLTGTTVYVTLEPCTERKPPKLECAARLTERHVRRVVIGMLDPDPRIRGNGVLALRRGGIAVELFPSDLMAEVEELNRHFIRSKTATRSAPSGNSPPPGTVQININNSTIGGDVVAGNKKP